MAGWLVFAVLAAGLVALLAVAGLGRSVAGWFGGGIGQPIGGGSDVTLLVLTHLPWVIGLLVWYYLA